jgi:hypothetical protein
MLEAPMLDAFSHLDCIMRKQISRVGQNLMNTPYMTVFVVISLPVITYVIYIYSYGQPYF